MKKFVLMAVLMSSMGAVAQAPAAPPPMAKPGLTLTTPAFDDGGIIPNKWDFGGFTAGTAKAYSGGG